MIHQMDVDLPPKCFISHAYADSQVRDRLIGILPEHVHAYAFPRISVPPDQFVSYHLIQYLLAYDGLIYLRGGHSDNSFWVAFERDYALRAGKQVFSTDVDSLKISQHSGGALDLATYSSYHSADVRRVREIANFLSSERYFDLWLDLNAIKNENYWPEEITKTLEDRIRRGGYAVVFWSRATINNKWIEKELQIAAERMPNFNDRVLFALLEDVPLPEFWRRFDKPSVQLFGDAKRSFTQRLDDLVVCLYWLIYRKTNQQSLDNFDA